MIIFLNIQFNRIELYDKNGMRTLSLRNVDSLNDIIDDPNTEIIYVTDAVSATTKDVIATVRAMGFNNQDRTNFSNEPDMLHSTFNGHIHIPEINLDFPNPSVFFNVLGLQKKYGENILNENAAIKTYLNNGYLEILPLSAAQIIMNEYEDELQKRIDRGLDNITMNDDELKSVLGKGDVDNDLEVKTADKDAVSIDLNSDLTKSFKRGSATGGSMSNEGSLLPEDF